MKNELKDHFVASLSCPSSSPAFPLVAQQEVVLTIREGMPMIPLALPDFIVRSASPQAKAAADEIRKVLEGDLRFSRVFQLLPSAHYGYIRPLSPDKIFFKDWDSIQAKLLLAGEIGEADGAIVFEGKLYDVKSERFILGKRYQAEKNALRLAAHRMADEIMKLYGEKPIFTSKIAFVSNRDGNDEIYMMDYDGAGQTRITFNRIKDYMPGWSPDQRRIVYTTYKRSNPDLVILSLYEGKSTTVAGRGTNFSGAFSPDGKKLAFCSTMDGNAEIYTADADGTKVKRLTFNSAIDTAPSWSPTGREIAFTSDRLGTGTPQIYHHGRRGLERPQGQLRRQLSRRPRLVAGRREDRLRLPGRQRLRHLHPEPAHQPDHQAHREQRQEREPVLVAGRPPHRLRLEPLGLDPDLHRRL